MFNVIPVSIHQIAYPGSYPAGADNIFYLSLIICGIVLLLPIILLILNAISWLKTDFLLRNINKIHRLFVLLNGLFLTMIILYFPVKYFNDLFNDVYKPLSYREIDLTYGGLVTVTTLMIWVATVLGTACNFIIYSKRKMDAKTKLHYKRLNLMWVITFLIFTLLTLITNALFFHYFYFPLLEKRPY